MYQCHKISFITGYDIKHRIVAKVDELMILCEPLKARLKYAQPTQDQLADAIVEKSL